jgi:hypothetical protein
MEKLTKAVETTVNGSGAGSFKGYAARFLNIDRDGDIILPGAFSGSIQTFIDDGGMVLADHENIQQSANSGRNTTSFQATPRSNWRNQERT